MSEVKKYAHLPTEIEAIRLTRKNAVEVAEWVGERLTPDECLALDSMMKSAGHAIEFYPRGMAYDEISAGVGDYVVRGICKTFYVIPGKKFKKLYAEAV